MNMKVIWRKDANDYYSPSICIRDDGKMGINANGTIFYAELFEWHKTGILISRLKRMNRFKRWFFNWLLK